VMLVVGGIGTAIVAAYLAYQWWKTRQSLKPAVVPAKVSPVAPAVVPGKATVVAPAVRGADDPAPAGAVEWYLDICAAMGSCVEEAMENSSARSLLDSLKAGESRRQASDRRIAILEQERTDRAPKPKTVVPAKEAEVKS